MSAILVIGATSAIAEATSRRFAQAGASLYLVARDENKLGAQSDALLRLGAGQVESESLDLTAFEKFADMLDRAEKTLGRLDIVLIAHGVLPETETEVRDPVNVRAVAEVNYVSSVLLVTEVVERLKKHGAGVVAVISSVAGDRGRASNYLYGSTKAGLTAFLEGLRSNLRGTGVHILTVKPGRVRTPMIAHLPSSGLEVDPEDVALSIEQGITRRKATVYVPSYLRLVMGVLKLLPEAIFSRLKF